MNKSTVKYRARIEAGVGKRADERIKKKKEGANKIF